MRLGLDRPEADRWVSVWTQPTSIWTPGLSVSSWWGQLIPGAFVLIPQECTIPSKPTPQGYCEDPKNAQLQVELVRQCLLLLEKGFPYSGLGPQENFRGSDSPQSIKAKQQDVPWGPHILLFLP